MTSARCAAACPHEAVGSGSPSAVPATSASRARAGFFSARQLRRATAASESRAEDREGYQPKAVARPERGELRHQASAVGTERVDEDHHLARPIAQIERPEGRGVEPQTLQVDAPGQARGRGETLKPRPVPQIPGGAGEDVAAVRRDEQQALTRLHHLHPRDRQARHARDAAQERLYSGGGSVRRRRPVPRRGAARTGRRRERQETCQGQCSWDLHGAMVSGRKAVGSRERSPSRCAFALLIAAPGGRCAGSPRG